MQGVVEQAEVDAFNLPVYFPRELIEKNGSFSVERVGSTKPEVEISTHSMIMHLRAAFEGILTKHFGESVVHQIFTNTLISQSSTNAPPVAGCPPQFYSVLLCIEA